MANSAEKPKQYFIAGNAMPVSAIPAGLYVVATPIGNLGDITLRALETLAAADLVLCEDTRQSAKLLDHYGIKTHRQAFHEHNERERIFGILERISGGQAVALISDAGTPLLSDPGFPLVRAAREAGTPITALPGASALLAGLAIAGLPTDRFGFYGFLPPKSGARKNALSALENQPGTLVFYESPRRIAAGLADMAEIFGADRQASVAMELTKKFERVIDGNLADLAAEFGDQPTRGEAVILVAGASTDATADTDQWQEALEQALADMPLRMAVDEITSTFSLKRKQVYDAALALKKAKS